MTIQSEEHTFGSIKLMVAADKISLVEIENLCKQYNGSVGHSDSPAISDRLFKKINNQNLQIISLLKGLNVEKAYVLNKKQEIHYQIIPITKYIN